MTHLGDIAVPRTPPHGHNGTTLPDLLASQAATRGASVALLHKDHGIWRAWTWQQADAAARRLAAGLAALGVERDEAVLIAGANRPRLLLAMLACQIHGAVPVLVPQAGGGVALAEALSAHAPRVAFVAGEDEVHAIHAARSDLRRQPVVICDDLRGLRSLWDTSLVAWDAFEIGTGPVEPQWPAATGAAAIVYTQGTDGPPKPLALTHRALVSAARAVVHDFALSPTDRSVQAVPQSWATALLLGPVQALVSGSALAFAENDATMLRDIREVGPTLLFGPPLLFRQIRQAAFLRVATASQPWRGLLERALGFGVPRAASQGVLARWLLKLLRDRLGLSRIRTAICTEAPLPPQLDAFFTALGIAVRTFADPRAEPPHAVEDLESRLRGSVFIRAAYVVARTHGAAEALVALDFEAVSQWAQLHGEPVRSIEDLGALAGVRRLLADEIAAATPQVARFLIAPSGLSPQAGDVTADGWLRRGQVEQLNKAALAELRAGGGIAVTARPPAPQPAPDAYDAIWPLYAGLGV